MRSAAVARQTGQRVIGVIENMAPLTLPDGQVLDLFGSGGGAAAAARLSTDAEPVALLGSIPLDPAVREAGDAGTPLASGPGAEAIARIAARIAEVPRGLAGRALRVTPER